MKKTHSLPGLKNQRAVFEVSRAPRKYKEIMEKESQKETYINSAQMFG